ncbi:MAG TPA: SprT family zinc-dependent metalloprotease [Burkholderiales bacterium]|nr:SprT family zinc-dependent metalloprotease [Burkholderiales bacterium]
MDKRRNEPDGKALKIIRLSGNDTAYVLKRSARRTVGLRIDPKGLTVSAPLRMSEKAIEDILIRKSGWILKKMGEAKPIPEPAWQEGEMLPFLGKHYRLRISASGRRNVRIDGECLMVSLPDLSKIKECVESWYKRQALDFFSGRVEHYCPRLDVEIPRLFLSNARTRWGSCNSRREVRLNWRLVLMDPLLVDYVVVHELSHLIEMNHSKAFWEKVESVYPAFETARKELRHGAKALW